MDEAEAADAETEGRSNADTHFGNGGNNMTLLFLWEIRKSFDLETAKAQFFFGGKILFYD